MYGIIDIGSNSIRLVLYKVENNHIRPLLNKKDPAGLARYIENSQLNQKGIDKAVEVLNEFDQILKNTNTKEVFVFATASIRNIDNTQQVVTEIKEKTGFNIDVITGDQEATFDYYGAVQTIKTNDGLLIDIGGGSTELVFFKDKMIYATYSLPIGSLNMYTKYVKDIIPTKKEVEKIEEKTTKLLKDIILPNNIDFSTKNIVGVGGTCRASYKFFKEFSQNQFDNYYDSKELSKLTKALETDNHNLVSTLLSFAPERIHTFLPGITILKAITKFYNSENIAVSHYGVREGYLLYILEERGILDVE